MKISTTLTIWEKVLGWLLLFLHILLLPFMVALFSLLSPVQLNTAVENIIYFVLSFLLSVAIFFRFLWENLKNFLHNIKRCIYTYFGSFALYFVLNIFVTIIVTNLSPEFSNANDAAISEMSQGYYMPMLFCTAFLVPITEELIYRGLIFQVLHQRSRILGYVVSCLIFSAIHVVGYIGSYSATSLVLSLLQYLPACISLAYAYEKSDSILTPIFIHMTINFIAMLLMR